MASNLVQEPLQQDLHKAAVHPIVQVTLPHSVGTRAPTPWRLWVGQGALSPASRPAQLGPSPLRQVLFVLTPPASRRLCALAVASGRGSCPRFALSLRKGKSPELRVTWCAVAGALGGVCAVGSPARTPGERFRVWEPLPCVECSSGRSGKGHCYRVFHLIKSNQTWRTLRGIMMKFYLRAQSGWIGWHGFHISFPMTFWKLGMS